MNILVLTDKSNISSLIKLIAEETAEHVFVVDYLENFKFIYQKYDLDIVMLDLETPCADGVYIVLRYLALHDSNSAIVIMSVIQGEVTDAIVRLGESLGLNMVGVLTKPIGPDELKTTLYKYLSMKSGSK